MSCSHRSAQHVDSRLARMLLNTGLLEYFSFLFYTLLYMVFELRPGWLIHKATWRRQESKSADSLKTVADLPKPAVRKKTVRDVPGPTPRLPILGTRWIYSWFGPYSINKVHEAYIDFFRQYGPVVREEALWNIPVVSILECEAIEKVLRYPSKYPLRPPTEITAYYRRSRPDRYTDLGIVNEQGSSWHRLRSMFTPEITSAKTMLRFLPEGNLIAEDFTALLRHMRDEEGRVPAFESLADRLALESTCTLILGRRMGFLEKEVDAKATELANAVHGLFRSMRDTYYGLPFWKIFPSRAYTQMVKSEEKIYDVVSDLLDKALAEEKDTCAVDAVQSVFLSILHAEGLDIRDKRANVIDSVASGIQTLGNTLIFLLYLVAKHPSVQQRLYEEVTSIAPPGSPLTGDSLRNATYLKACVNEAFRVLPTAPCVARILEAEMELSGYHLPAGTVVVCHTWLACQQDANFTDAKQFRPERWLPEHKNDFKSSPFIALPFGGGKRMCPGKRFTEQKLFLFLAKLIREFHIEFEGELKLQFEFLLTPEAPNNFIFRDRLP